MKSRIQIVAVCLALLGCAAQGETQTAYTEVYDLYYQLALYPENGDSYIAQNMARFDSQFFSCLSVVRSRALQEGQAYTDMCNQKPTARERAECEKGNEPAKMWSWTNDAEQFCKGQVLWSDTMIGAAAIFAKRELEKMMPGQYEQIVRGVLPNYRYLMVCQ